MPRPKRLHDHVNLGFRIDGRLLERLDAYCKRLGAEHGFEPSRSDAIRVLLDRALSAEGIPAEAPAKGGTTKAKRKR